MTDKITAMAKIKTVIYKTSYRKPKLEQHEPRQKSGVNSGAPGWLAVSPPHVTLIV
jgi:hypothetical protein